MVTSGLSLDDLVQKKPWVNHNVACRWAEEVMKIIPVINKSDRQNDRPTDRPKANRPGKA